MLHIYEVIMVELSYPGVYVVETPPVARAMTAASTSTASFIGMTERGPTGEAMLVTSLTEFFDKFGSFTTKNKMGIKGAQENDVYLPYAVWSFFQNGGSKCYIIRIAPNANAARIVVTASGKPGADNPPKEGEIPAEVKFSATEAPFGEAEAPVEKDSLFRIWASSRGVWGNNLQILVGKGSDQIIINKDGKDVKEDTFRIDVKLNGAVVESHDGLTMRPDNQRSVKTMINDSSKLVRITQTSDNTALPTEATYKLEGGSAGNDVTNKEIVTQLTDGTSVLDKVTNVSLISAPGYSDGEIANAGFKYAEGHRNQLGDAFFIAEVPKMVDTRDEGLKYVKSLTPGVNGYGSVYFPWMKVRDQLGTGRNPITLVPPSGFVAGVFARIDNTRGVWKTPAGAEASVAGVLGLTANLTDKDQGVINLAGLNAIRNFPGKGTLIWGGRTPSPDIAWRYLSVRRMANFLKSSIFDGIQWAVFEPNDSPLWGALKMNIEGFMRDLFRQGAFQGSSTEEAFFVKCDAETTTSTDQQNGLVNVLVGFAPLKPAEFIVIKLSQKMSEAAA
jgi:phage tail sheath protein FI